MDININFSVYCTVLIFALFIDATHSIQITQYRKCCPQKRSTLYTGDIVIRIPRQLPFSRYNPLFLRPEADPYSSSGQNFGLILPPPIYNEDAEATKAFSCSLMVCRPEDQTGAVCACNFNTGNVVSFKNQCDVLKHNCRFDTGFRIILPEICPWEFQSRRDNRPIVFDYSSSKYYN